MVVVRAEMKESCWVRSWAMVEEEEGGGGGGGGGGGDAPSGEDVVGAVIVSSSPISEAMEEEGAGESLKRRTDPSEGCWL